MGLAAFNPDCGPAAPTQYKVLTFQKDGTMLSQSGGTGCSQQQLFHSKNLRFKHKNHLFWESHAEKGSMIKQVHGLCPH
jgi:hypothetical protein